MGALAETKRNVWPSVDIEVYALVQQDSESSGKSRPSDSSAPRSVNPKTIQSFGGL